MTPLPPENITLKVDAEAAKIFKTSSSEERAKLEILVSSLLKEYGKSNPDTLKQTMDEISQKAQARGLTPEILAAILEEE